ncbi:DNA methyltransferase [Fusobacterium ulcerans]|uniref:DNA methyltransferase n=1 Tax=Fusobacterium ulcerans TaxID=861 RepID=UPI0026735F96|nr:DNA methyltransferase [Fusobacterium ulcerans]
MEDKLNNFKPLSELLDSVRNIDGFPIGKDKDILALSDAPYYTACPNPYINDFIEAYGILYDEDIDTYSKTPYIGDVSEGKTDPIYRAYNYHTQVPYKAIMKFIEHYTKENDIILDAFSGTGTTGIAATSLKRNAILSDLSPLASLISFGLNNCNLDTLKIKEYKYSITQYLKKECGWMYQTYEEDGTKIDFSYVVWSNIYICPYCNTEFDLWNFSVIEHEDGTRDSLDKFKCKKCNSELETRKIKRKIEEKYDSSLNKIVKTSISNPILIIYKSNGKSIQRKLNEKEINIIKKIDELEIPFWLPTNRMPEGDESRRNDVIGIKHVHQFYTKRTLYTLAAILNYIKKIDDTKYRNFFLNAFLACLPRASKQNRYIPKYGNRHVGILSGTLYMPHFSEESNLIEMYNRRIDLMTKAQIGTKGKILIGVQSSTNLSLKNNSIDYIFTDPPFGANIMYSELSFIRESWLQLKTNNRKEAIISKIQEKNNIEYKKLMIDSFKEYYRVLKPNRWITVEFHNSKAAVWNIIQESITKAGFIIAQVAVLDKQKGSINQMFSAGAVSKDLVINAYKPKTEFKERFLKSAGEGMDIEFVKQQLNHLPIEPNVERTEQMLYSKMLAHYIENGFKIKYNSQNFFELLENNFVELDGYWFDESEVLRYNKWKSKQGNLDKIKELKNAGMILFINNEKTALQWIYQFLNEPKSYSDILTSYNMIVDSKSKDEIPELREMLDNNFFTEEGKYRRPYTRDERKQLKKSREKELEKAWEKILDRAKNEKNKIKTVRKEAVEYGFKKCYDKENYQDIILVGKKLHDSILEENSDITEFIEIAEIKLDI